MDFRIAVSTSSVRNLSNLGTECHPATAALTKDCPLGSLARDPSGRSRTTAIRHFSFRSVEACAQMPEKDCGMNRSPIRQARRRLSMPDTAPRPCDHDEQLFLESRK